MATSARSRPRLALAAGGSGDGSGGIRMTAQLRQAIALLRLSSLELIEEIRKECEAAADPTR